MITRRTFLAMLSTGVATIPVWESGVIHLATAPDVLRYAIPPEWVVGTVSKTTVSFADYTPYRADILYGWPTIQPGEVHATASVQGTGRVA